MINACHLAHRISEKSYWIRYGFIILYLLLCVIFIYVISCNCCTYSMHVICSWLYVWHLLFWVIGCIGCICVGWIWCLWMDGLIHYTRPSFSFYWRFDRLNYRIMTLDTRHIQYIYIYATHSKYCDSRLKQFWFCWKWRL